MVSLYYSFLSIKCISVIIKVNKLTNNKNIPALFERNVVELGGSSRVERLCSIHIDAN